LNRIVHLVLRMLTLGRWPAEGGPVRAPQAARTVRRVWRITDSKPEGEWVDADSTPPAPAHDERSTLPMDSWATSSMDLLDGVQIVEHTDSQLPDELRPPAHRRLGERPH
jgi:hypothetical protein